MAYASDCDKLSADPGNEPVELSRWLIGIARERGAVALTYHVSDVFDSFRKSLPHLYFTAGQRTSRHSIPMEHAEALGRCNEFLIKLGKPIILSNYLDRFHKAEPRLTDEIMSGARARGVEDQLMVPVYGPFMKNGAVTFAFPRKLDESRDRFLVQLETAAYTFHNRTVRHFASEKEDSHLSKRENEVLKWIARGKTNSEIATILNIRSASVNTYIKRIFEKMNVHDRVSAAVQGIQKQIIR